METLQKIALVLVIIGALNWGLVGLFEFDLVAMLFGSSTNILAKIVYILIAICGIINIALLLSPFILNIMETIIIKRFKPLYLHLFTLLIILIIYYLIIYFFGKMGMNIGDFPSERLSQIKFIIQLAIFTILGSIGGWWLYRFLTKPKIKKINLSSSIDSSELSEG